MLLMCRTKKRSAKKDGVVWNKSRQVMFLLSPPWRVFYLTMNQTLRQGSGTASLCILTHSDNSSANISLWWLKRQLDEKPVQQWNLWYAWQCHCWWAGKFDRAVFWWNTEVVFQKTLFVELLDMATRQISCTLREGCAFSPSLHNNISVQEKLLCTDYDQDQTQTQHERWVWPETEADISWTRLRKTDCSEAWTPFAIGLCKLRMLTNMLV